MSLPNADVSYFITIETDPEEAAHIRSATYSKNDSLFDLFQASYENGALTFELKAGTTAQDDEIEDAFLKLSALFPGDTFHFQRTCEEPYAPDRAAAFRNGEAVYDRYSRFLEPETALDPVTKDAILDALNAAGMTDAARLVESMPEQILPEG